MSQLWADICANFGQISKKSINFFLRASVVCVACVPFQAACALSSAGRKAAVAFLPRMQRTKNNRLSLAPGDPVIEPMPAWTGATFP
ncbi:hypothetical protein [Achromobacter mucicolens]|uniref:hypothetical protein n=1 Tax=Achromobacter mucicolens TaxID=1389922 RepID=UPI0011B299B9|nr:hypothetical protein [Achromobacter mucicolens]